MPLGRCISSWAVHSTFSRILGHFSDLLCSSAFVLWGCLYPDLITLLPSTEHIFLIVRAKSKATG